MRMDIKHMLAFVRRKPAGEEWLLIAAAALAGLSSAGLVTGIQMIGAGR